MSRSKDRLSQVGEESRQGTDSVPITQVGTRLQENSGDEGGNHLRKGAGESFTWNPTDRERPNPTRPGRR